MSATLLGAEENIDAHLRALHRILTTREGISASRRSCWTYSDNAARIQPSSDARVDNGGTTSVKMFGRVGIVCDNKLLDEALALRAVLESYGIQVAFHRFIQKRQIFTFFADPHPEHSHTILVCHGSGDDEDPHLMFEVVDQAESRYDDPEGWDGITVRWTAAEVLKYVRGGHGTVLSLACGSGRAPLAQAFLQAGFQAYIGPVSHYLDTDSALLFAVNFFYFLLAEDRDYAPAHYAEPEAVKKAAAVDAGWEYGTESFSFYPARGG